MSEKARVYVVTGADSGWRKKLQWSRVELVT